MNCSRSRARGRKKEEAGEGRILILKLLGMYGGSKEK